MYNNPKAVVKEYLTTASDGYTPGALNFAYYSQHQKRWYYGSRIYTIRRVKVMLDADLAEIYGYSLTVRKVVARGGMIIGISILTKSFVLAHTLAARILP